jgi:hypothetical protein
MGTMFLCRFFGGKNETGTVCAFGTNAKSASHDPYKNSTNHVKIYRELGDVRMKIGYYVHIDPRTLP